MNAIDTPLPVTARTGPVAALGRLLNNREAAFWALHSMGWSAYFVAQYLGALLSDRNQPGHFQVLVVAAIGGFLLSAAMRPLYRRIWYRDPAVLATTVLLVVYVAAIAWRIAINGAYVLFVDDQPLHGPWWTIFTRALTSTYLFLCWSALYIGIHYYEHAQRERENSLRAMALAQEAQMKMLRYQLNPHFLFNTLNAISTLILDRDNSTANGAVTRLSAFLRHTLDQDPMKRVTLAQELEALDLYLGIEQLRFGNRLRLVRDVDPAAERALVPSLLLQPLIENALKYAVAPREAGGTLTLSAKVIGTRLLLHVADDGPGLPNAVALGSGGRGVGLRNTRERLLVLYGDRARFASFNTNPGLRVDIEIPADYAS